MSLISKKDFADRCGLETKHLSTYINRGKIILTGDEFDDENEINKYFIEFRKGKNENIIVPPVPEEKLEPAAEKLNKRVAEKKTEQPQTKFDFPPAEGTMSEGFKLDTEAKRLQNQKTENEIAIQNAKLSKLTGDSIPTQLVQSLITHHSKSITVAFRHGAETFLMQVGKKSGMNRTDMAALKVELIQIINNAVNDSIAISIKEIKNIISEHSQKREQGERT